MDGWMEEHSYILNIISIEKGWYAGEANKIIVPG